MGVIRGLSILACLLAAGCAGSKTAPGVYVASVSAAGDGPSNLAFGGARSDVYVALEMGGRSRWPATISGYRFNDTTYYSEIQFDDQFFFDRFNGFHRTEEVFRTGVMIR